MALDTGFADGSHFSRRFRDAFGKSPSEVRREAARLGFTRAVVPRVRSRDATRTGGIEVVEVGSLADAVRAALA